MSQDLIEALVDDLEPVRPVAAVGSSFAGLLVVGAAATALVVFGTGPLRPGALGLWREAPLVQLEGLAAVFAVVASLVGALQLAQPDVGWGRRAAWWPVLGFAAWLGVLAWQAIAPPVEFTMDASLRLFGSMIATVPPPGKGM